ncbi:hypothetical protein [Micromonospora auratinigra]|uniref:Uncharacterized protein n=1 Tax=Micromonospora auratinigra TaxID=261654 RepID=A0A1A8ZJ51_9ACTN|nr:hypothetical protein [Micromonospora auratinigra]SBT43873.1 hypothetical protein GA0070611_2488 [Micromonospora auratinigra]
MTRTGWRLPAVTAAWCAAYAALHVLWAVRGAPRFGGNPGESFLPEGWAAVAPAVLGTVAAGLLLASPAADGRRWAAVAAVAGWLGGTWLLLYAFMFPISVLTVLGGLFGQAVTADDVAVLAARAGGAAAGTLTVLVAVMAGRRARGACPRCGRLPGRRPARRTDPTPRWAYAAGLATVAACLARLAAGVPEGTVSRVDPGTSGTFLSIFMVGMVLAGTLLPLALVHRWGRIWPGWVVPLAGRPVPRWLVLGPAFFLGAGMVGYFGVGGTYAWASGLVPGGAFLAVTLSAYTLWGVGLLVSAAGYLRLTRPPCPDEGSGRLSVPAGMMAA